MKKTNARIAALLSAALVFASAAPLVSEMAEIKIFASYDSGPCGENAMYTLKNGILTISGTGPTDQSYGVVPAPWDQKAVEKIIVEEGITAFSSNVFANCVNLKEVSISGSVEYLGVGAFSGCTSLETIIIPEGVKTIFGKAFSGCKALKSVYLPKTVEYIENNPFVGCQNLDAIVVDTENATYHSDGKCLIYTAQKSLVAGTRNSVIPSDGSVTRIDKSAFEGVGITDIVIPDTVTSIQERAFKNCTKLESVTLPSGLTEIPLETFIGCTGLKAITVPEGVERIESRSFADCINLKEIVIPKSVTQADNNPFVGCSGLESIKVADGNSTYRAVDNCLININKKEVIAGCKTSVIPSDGSVQTIAENAFSGIGTITEIEIPEGITSIGMGAFKRCRGLRSVSLPNTLSKLEGQVFWECSALTEIEIPASVTSIDERPFAYCNELSSITVEEGNAVYHAAGNCLIETESGKLIAGCNESIIPSDGSVTSIGPYAFQGCEELASLVVPEGVKSIEAAAFYDCNGLMEIYLPESLCSIGKSAFYRADNIFDIYYAGTEQQWNSLEKNGADGDLKGTTIHYGVDPNLPLPEGVAGDINTDGKIDTKDLTRLMKMISAGSDKENADVTGDGKIDTKDLTRLMKYLGGFSVELH